MKIRHLICNIGIVLVLFLSWTVDAAKAQEEAPQTLDLVFVIDNSNSMQDTDEFDLRVATARVLIDTASTDFEASRVRIGVITFGDEAVQRTDGLVYANTIEHARDVVEAELQRNTVIEYAFEEAYQMLEDGGSYAGPHNSAVLFMTDGRPFDGRTEEPTSEDYERMFDDAQPWIDRLAQNSTPVYIASFNAEGEQMPVVDRERWEAFAEVTGGEYYDVENVQEASSFFEDVIVNLVFLQPLNIIVDGQEIEPGDVIRQDFEVDAFLDRFTIAAVHTNQQATYIQTRLFWIDEDGGEVEILCGQDSPAMDDILCRGGTGEDTETVRTLIRPQPGTWRVEFRGGKGYIKAWTTQRVFHPIFVQPEEGVLLAPGDSLDVEIGLCETAREALELCRENPDAYVVQELDYPEKFLESLEMRLVIDDPTSSNTQRVTMAYDMDRTRFTYAVTQEAVRGIYRLDAFLYYGQEIRQLGANSQVVYVSYLPEIQSIEFSETEDDGRTGLSAREPISARILLTSPELAMPGSLEMVGTLTHPNGDQTTITPTAVSGINNLFEVSLGAFEDPGTYEVQTRLMGQIQLGDDEPLSFGGTYEPQVRQAATFEITPLMRPTLEEISVVSETTTGQYVPVSAVVSLSRREDRLPDIRVELIEDNTVIDSLRLETEDNPFPTGLLSYEGDLTAPQRPGEYTVQFLLDEEAVNQAQLRTQFPVYIRLGIGAGIVVVLGTVATGAYWFFFVRDLVPRVVIGTLKIEKKNAEGDYEEIGEPVALSRDSRKEVYLARFAPDEEVAEVKARLVGRVKNRRELVEPILKMKRKTSLITVNDVAGEEHVLVDGAKINTPNYQLTYHLKKGGGGTNIEFDLPRSDEDSPLPTSEPTSSGINV